MKKATLFLSIAFMAFVGLSAQAGHNDHRNSHAHNSGHYEYVYKKVWVPARCERVWIDACYEWRTDGCGRSYRVCVSAGRYDTRTIPGYYTSRRVKTWHATRNHRSNHKVRHQSKRYSKHRSHKRNRNSRHDHHGHRDNSIRVVWNF